MIYETFHVLFFPALEQFIYNVGNIFWCLIEFFYEITWSLMSFKDYILIVLFISSLMILLSLFLYFLN